MKKISFFAFALSAIALTSACKTTKQKENLTEKELSGKWTITAVNNKDVKADKTLFIDFMPENRVHAEVGCNLYNNTYAYDAEANTLTFSPNGQMTMMMCPDMNTETAIVSALNATSKIAKAATTNCINLLNEKGDIVLTLCK